MNSKNLQEISYFMKKNNSFSDFNHVNLSLFNLNYTNLNLNKNKNNQFGGNNIDVPIINNPESNITNNNSDMLNPNILNTNMANANMSNPNILNPDMSNPDMSNPNILNPNILNPDMSNPNMLNPNILNPDMLNSNMTNPDMLNPDILNSNILNPDMLNSNMTNADMLNSNMLNPDISNSNMSNPNILNLEIYNNEQQQLGENLNTDNILNQNIQTFPDMYLKNPGFTSDYINTYTIKEGTILYHATINKKGFNTNYLELGKDKLINFFTPNFRLASDKIEGCSVDKQNGYIHVFKVKKDIPNIYVKLPYDIADDIDTGKLANEFCSKNQNYFGIGFFYPKNNIEMFSNNIEMFSNNQTQQFDEINYYSEFGICNPRPYLEYIYSQKCMSLRKLSEPYRFN